MSEDVNERQFVTLALGDEVFAVPVELVREILDYRPAFAIPDGPAYLLGLMDVRGRATPTLDLRVKLGMAAIDPTPHTRILVLDIPVGDRLLSLGLMADRVIEVISVMADDIEPPPDIGVAWRSEYIRGIVRRQDSFVVLFDLGRLLTTSEAIAIQVDLAA